MAKSQTNQGTSMANNLSSYSMNTANDLMGASQQNQSNSQQQANSTFAGAQQGYTTAQSTGGYDPTQLANLRAQMGTNTSTGGFNPGDYSNIQSTLGQAGSTAAGFTGSSGAFDPSTLSNVLGGYGQMAQTGGYTPAMSQAFLNNATSGLTNTYNTLSNQAKQAQTATGGLGTGGGIAQMARQLSQQQAQATTSAQSQLDQNIIGNQLQGLSGEEGTEAAVANSRLSGLSAQTSAGSAQFALAQALAGNRLSATGQQENLESGVASGSLAGTSGLAGLYGTASGTGLGYGNQAISSFGTGVSGMGDAASVMANLSKNPGTLSSIGNFVTALLG